MPTADRLGAARTPVGAAGCAARVREALVPAFLGAAEGALGAVRGPRPAPPGPGPHRRTSVCFRPMGGPVFSRRYYVRVGWYEAESSGAPMVSVSAVLDGEAKTVECYVSPSGLLEGQDLRDAEWAVARFAEEGPAHAVSMMLGALTELLGLARWEDIRGLALEAMASEVMGG